MSLDLPHLPDMVFHNNTLTLEHENGARLEFNPMEALKKVRNEKLDLKVSCSEEWKESRPKDHTEEKFKPFDWTFSTDYQGNENDKFDVETSETKIDKFKLMVKENILFYSDLTLYEDELHDNGTSVCSVKVVISQPLIFSPSIHICFYSFSASCRLVSIFFCATFSVLTVSC